MRKHFGWIVFGSALALAGCDVPDMDADEPGDPRQIELWTPVGVGATDELGRRERLVREEIEEARREMREGDPREEAREGWAEIQAARRGEGTLSRALEGLGAQRDAPVEGPDEERW